jgi:hypothetical protein
MPTSISGDRAPEWLDGAAYPAGANCTLGIKVHPGSHLELKLTYMVTEYPYDFLQIYDIATGSSMEPSNAIETLSGEQSGRIINWTPSKGKLQAGAMAPQESTYLVALLLET